MRATYSDPHPRSPLHEAHLLWSWLLARYPTARLPAYYASLRDQLCARLAVWHWSAYRLTELQAGPSERLRALHRCSRSLLVTLQHL